jgi:hypothetical protein
MASSSFSRTRSRYAQAQLLQPNLPDGANEANCKSYDWKIVTQSRESQNVLIYNPGDVGAGVCVGNKFVIALPVRVLWADVGGLPQLPDPQRSGPATFEVVGEITSRKPLPHATVMPALWLPFTKMAGCIRTLAKRDPPRERYRYLR